MNESIQKFMNASSFREAASLVKVGFELETQSFCGNTTEDFDSMCSSDSSYWEDMVNDWDFYSSIVNKDDPESHYFDGISNSIRNAVIDWVRSVIESKFYIDISQKPTKNIEHMTNHMVNFIWDSDRSREERNEADALMCTFWEIKRSSSQYESYEDAVSRTASHWNDRLQVHQDGSVEGPEIVTPPGGVTVEEFMSLANKLFQNSMKINEGCSFHIHISLPGVKHKFGKNFQMACLEYLMKHKASMPKSVIQRFYEANTEDIDYFRPRIGTNRYSFVAYRGQTWEFRCWGNVYSSYQAVKCLFLTIKAFQHAYKVVYAGEKLYNKNYLQNTDEDDMQFEFPYELYFLSLAHGTIDTSITKKYGKATFEEWVQAMDKIAGENENSKEEDEEEETVTSSDFIDGCNCERCRSARRAG